MILMQSSKLSPPSKAVTSILICSALIVACFAPALSMQKDYFSYDHTNTQRPVVVSYLA